MSANIQKVKCPPLLRRSFLAPDFEITLLAVVIPVASAMAGLGVCAALALVDGVMTFYLLSSADRLSAEITTYLDTSNPYSPSATCVRTTCMLAGFLD